MLQWPQTESLLMHHSCFSMLLHMLLLTWCTSRTLTGCTTWHWQSVSYDTDRVFHRVYYLKLTECITWHWQRVLHDTDIVYHMTLTECIIWHWHSASHDTDRVHHMTLTECTTWHWHGTCAIADRSTKRTEVEVPYVSWETGHYGLPGLTWYKRQSSAVFMSRIWD